MGKAVRSCGLVALALILVGCIGGTDLPPALPEAGAGATSLSFSSCRGQELDLAVAFEDAAARVPDGFEPTRPMSFSEGDPAGRTAYLMLVTEACENSTVFFAWLPVVPPAELVDETAVLHVVQLGLATDDARAAEALRDWNVTAVSGELAWSDGPGLADGVQESTVHVAADGLSWSMSTVVQVAGAHDAPAEKVRAFVVRNGALVNAYDMLLTEHTHRSGGSSITLSGETPLFPTPLAGQSYGSDILPFDGFELRYVPPGLLASD